MPPRRPEGYLGGFSAFLGSPHPVFWVVPIGRVYGQPLADPCQHTIYTFDHRCPLTSSANDGWSISSRASDMSWGVQAVPVSARALSRYGVYSDPSNHEPQSATISTRSP